jgi:hypothetical protein
MATYSKKMMGKEVGNAKFYAKPHNMSGKTVTPTASSGKNMSRADTVDMSIGNIDKTNGGEPKTSGIKIRGTGAATKGVMARGPMA